MLSRAEEMRKSMVNKPMLITRLIKADRSKNQELYLIILTKYVNYVQIIPNHIHIKNMK